MPGSCVEGRKRENRIANQSLCISLQRVHESSISKLVKAATSCPIITTSTFSSRAIAHHQVTVLFSICDVQPLQNTIVIIEKLPDRANIASTTVTDNSLGDIAVSICRVRNIIAKVVFRSVFSPVMKSANAKKRSKNPKR